MKDLTFAQYQDAARTTRLESAGGISYAALGLVGEAGEIANKAKKLLRDGDSPEKREAIAKELGDVLWYLSALADDCGFSLAAVAEQNLAKLAARLEKGTIGGSGDNR